MSEKNQRLACVSSSVCFK